MLFRSKPVLDLLRTLPVEEGNELVFIGRSAGSGLGNTALADITRFLRKGGRAYVE